MTEEKRGDIVSSTQCRFKWRHIFIIIFICVALGVCLLGGNTQILRDERAPEEIKNMMWAIDAVKHVPDIVGVFIILLIPSYLLWAFWPPLTAWFKSLNRKAQTNKAETTPQPFDVEQLSDAAIELIVCAALAQKKEIYLKEEKIYFDLLNPDNDESLFYFDFPERVAKHKDVLEELATSGLLQRNRYTYALNQNLINQNFKLLLEIDNNRIVRDLPSPGKNILRHIQGREGVVCCEWHSATRVAGICTIRFSQDVPNGCPNFSGSGNAVDVYRTLFMFQKNRLVKRWTLKEGPQTAPSSGIWPSSLNFSYDSPTHGSMSFIGPPDEKKLKPAKPGALKNNAYWVESGLTERGAQIAALFQAKPLSDGAALDDLQPETSSNNEPIPLAQAERQAPNGNNGRLLAQRARLCDVIIFIIFLPLALLTFKICASFRSHEKSPERQATSPSDAIRETEAVESTPELEALKIIESSPAPTDGEVNDDTALRAIESELLEALGKAGVDKGAEHRFVLRGSNGYPEIWIENYRADCSFPFEPSTPFNTFLDVKVLVARLEERGWIKKEPHPIAELNESATWYVVLAPGVEAIGKATRQAEARESTEVLEAQEKASPVDAMGTRSKPIEVAAPYLPPDVDPAELFPGEKEKIPTPPQTESVPVPHLQETVPTPLETENVPVPHLQETVPTPPETESVPVPTPQETIPTPPDDQAALELSAEAQDVIRMIAVMNCDVKPGVYFYLRGLETKSREIVTYNNALVFPAAYPAQDPMNPSHFPNENVLPAIYCGDARNTLEKTINELIKADALKIGETFFPEPPEFSSYGPDSRPIWFVLTSKGQEIYAELNKREKRVFKLAVTKREFRNDSITTAVTFYELYKGIVTITAISGAESSVNNVKTQNTLPMITCELISLEDSLFFKPENTE